MLHVIWRRGYYPGIGAPSWTADYGSETANHYDHVHIATNGGGYPTGNETYYLGIDAKPSLTSTLRASLSRSRATTIPAHHRPDL